MIFRKFMTKKLTKAAEVVVEPAKKAVQDKIDAAKQSVGNGSNMGAQIFKFLLAGFLVFFTFREEQQQNPVQPRLQAPMPNIVINNYIRDKEEKHGNNA